MTFVARRATRRGKPLKLAVTGPAGSGKTLAALALARSLHPTGRVIVADTENGSAELYSDRYEYDAGEIAPPFTTAKYLAALRYAESEGAVCLILDSLSHAWDGDGGILDRKQQEEARGGAKVNGFALWARYKAEWRDLVAAILHSRVDVIVTMRSKVEHVQTERDGRKVVEKLGMAPIVGEGADYEFSVVFDLNAQHVATCSKDRTGMFADPNAMHDLVHENVGERIRKWRDEGGVYDPSTAPRVWFAETSSYAGTDEEALATQVGRQRASDLSRADVVRLIERAEGRVLDPGQRAVADALVAVSRILAERARADAVQEDGPDDDPDAGPPGDGLPFADDEDGPTAEAVADELARDPEREASAGGRPPLELEPEPEPEPAPAGDDAAGASRSIVRPSHRGGNARARLADALRKRAGA